MQISVVEPLITWVRPAKKWWILEEIVSGVEIVQLLQAEKWWNFEETVSGVEIV